MFVQKKRMGFQFLLPAMFVVTVTASPGSSLADGKKEKAVRSRLEKRRAYEEQARSEFEEGRYDEALQILQEAEREFPHISQPHVTMALMHLAAGHSKAAEVSLDRAAAEDAQDPEAFVLLAELSLRDGRLTVASLAYQHSVVLLGDKKLSAPKREKMQSRIHAGLASISEAQGRFNEAKRHLTQWLKLDSQNPMALGSLGRVNFELKEYDAARSAFRNLEKTEQDAPPTEISMGRLFTQSGMKTEARRSMEAAVKRRPKDVRVRLVVAEWALEAGLNDLAESNVEAALSLDQQSLIGRILSARLARQTGNTSKAIAMLRGVLKETSNNFSVRNELYLAMAASDDISVRKQALDESEKVYKARSKTRSAQTYQAAITYGWLLFRQDRIHEAEALMNFIPHGYPISNEAAYYAGRIYSSRGNVKQARAMLKAALQKDMAFPFRDEAEQLQKQLAADEEKTISARN